MAVKPSPNAQIMPFALYDTSGSPSFTSGNPAKVSDEATLAAIGAIADAVAAAGDVGTLSAKLRRLTTDLDALLTKVGEIQASPTANTVLDRLKTIGEKDFASEETLTEIKEFDGGVATGGSKTTIIDTGKDWETNMFSGHMAKVTIADIEYYRTVSSNTATTLTISTLPGAAASAIIGTPGTAEVTVTCATEGVGGNEYTAEVVEAPGDNDNLSASLTGLVLTVYLGKTGGVLDGAKNTATLVATAIDQLPEFTAAMTGTGGVVPVAAAVTFTGGVAVVDVVAGSEYQIMRKVVISDGGSSITVDQTTHDNLNANANLQVGNADVADLNPVPTKLIGSNAGASEVLTVNNTVGGVGFTGAKITGQTKAFVTVETAQIRFTLDGTAPTTAVGHLLEIGDILKLDSTADLASFRAIRTGAVSASLQCTYSV